MRRAYDNMYAIEANSFVQQYMAAFDAALKAGSAPLLQDYYDTYTSPDYYGYSYIPQDVIANNRDFDLSYFSGVFASSGPISAHAVRNARILMQCQGFSVFYSFTFDGQNWFNAADEIQKKDGQLRQVGYAAFSNF